MMPPNYYINLGPLSHVSEETCRMTLLRGNAQIHIKVDIAQVKDTSFGQEVLQHLELWKGRPWGRARDKPIVDQIYQYCLPLIERLAPDVLLHDLSLEAFLHSPTYNIQLMSGGADRGIHIEGQDDIQYTPAFFTSPMSAADLPELPKTIPHFQARDISIAPIPNDGKTIDAVHGRVLTADGTPMYFKPRQEMREQEFERELCILSRITEANLPSKLRVPKLEGLVFSTSNEIIGLLMTMIPSSDLGPHLRSPGLIARSDLHTKWEQQLTAIVRELHAHDIVWGDVHPMNIIIDDAMDAWAVDFGGLNNARFVDDEKRETREGDWQGIGRIFGEWLLDPERRW